MSGCLYCNNYSCRAPLVSGQFYVTFCSHIFCASCGEAVAANLKCIACEALLQGELTIMESDLNPREEWKHLILAGLSPTIILEVATKALAFHYHQSQMEVKYLNAKLERTNGRLGQCKEYYEQVIDQLKQKIETLEIQLRTKQQLNEDIRQTSPTIENSDNFQQSRPDNYMPTQPQPRNSMGLMRERTNFGTGNVGTGGMRRGILGVGGNFRNGNLELGSFASNKVGLDSLRSGNAEFDFLRNENEAAGNSNIGLGSNVNSNIGLGSNVNSNIGLGSNVNSIIGLGSSVNSNMGLGSSRNSNIELGFIGNSNLGLGNMSNMGIVSSETVFRSGKVRDNGNLFGSDGHLSGLGRLRTLSGDTGHLHGTLSGSSLFKPGIYGSFGKSARGRIQTTRSITNVTENVFKGKKLF